MFDIDNVLMPIYPSDYDDKEVIWYGDYYMLSVANTTMEGVRTLFFITSEENYIEKTERFGNWDQYKDCESVTKENRDGVDVTVYDYNAGNDLEPSPRRYCTYTLSDADTELFVLEFYDVDLDLQIPINIEIFGKTGDQYFTAYVSTLAERPSPEWLLEFDLKPYAECTNE